MQRQFFHSTQHVREANLLGPEPPLLINFGGKVIELQRSETERRVQVMAQEQRIRMENYDICFALEAAARRLTGDDRAFTRTHKTKFYTGHYDVTLVARNEECLVQFDLDTAEQDFDKAVLDALASVGIN